MTQVVEQQRGRGRPRDATIDGRALQAASQLLVERGFDATTMQAVARRSGLHPSALYRRWPSRIELIEEATFPGLSPLSVTPTGDLRGDLRRFFTAYLDTFSTPAARAAAGGLLSYNQTSPPRRSELYDRVSARPGFKAILHAADPALVDQALDPDDVFDMVLGAVLVRILLANISTKHPPLERSIQMVMRILRPDPG